VRLAFPGGGKLDQRVVPPTGFTARLTIFAAAAMGFLAVFSLALALAAARLADRWDSALSQSATVRISAPAGQVEQQVSAALAALQTTPGVAGARRIDVEEEKRLLAPWFGPDLPMDVLDLPVLIEVVAADPGYDAEGLRLRLQAEAPGAVLDDHGRWRRPLVLAAGRLRLMAEGAMALIAATTAAIITLAAQAALSANWQVVRVLRLIGGTDAFIARAFVRRFTLRALGGAAIGTVAGVLAVVALPAASPEAGFLSGLGFQGASWALVPLIPLLAAITAFLATRLAAFRMLKGVT
jgi:cell division transport system permease protein